MNIWDVERPVGLDGKPIALGGSLAEATHKSEARMNAHLAEWEASNLEQTDKLTQKLRKEYDELRMANKQRQRAMTQVCARNCVTLLVLLCCCVSPDSNGRCATCTGKAALRPPFPFLAARAHLSSHSQVADELSRIERVMAADAARRSKAHQEVQAIHSTEDEREEARLNYEDTLRARDMYLFMQERLKNEKTDMQLELRRLKKSQVDLEKLLKDTTLQNTSSKNEATRAETLVMQLRARLEHARDARAEKIAAVEHTMKAQAASRAHFTDRAQQRMTTQGKPRRDLDEAQEERMKELFLVRKVYSNMLLRKLREDQRRTDKLEGAFQRIRAATGLSDVRAIVSKFLQRADTQASLNASADAARSRIEALQREQKALRWRLDEVETEGGLEGEDRTLFSQVEDLNRQVTESKRKCGDAKERFHRVNVTLEECRAATAKLLHKLVVADAKHEESQGGTRGGHQEHGVEAGVAAALHDVVGTLQAQAEQSSSAREAAAAEEVGLRLHSSSEGAMAQAVTGQGLGMSASLATLLPANRLDLALNQVESRVSKLLAHLAGVVELEESAATKRAMETGSDSGASGDGKISESKGEGGVTPGSLYSSLFRASRGGLSAAALGAGQGSARASSPGSPGGIGGAGAALWSSGVPLPPNTEAENVRVAPAPKEDGPSASTLALQRLGREGAMDAPGVGGGVYGGYADEEEGGEDDEGAFSGGAGGGSGVARVLGGGVGANTIVDRRSLKRLSNLLADRKRGARLQQLAADTAGNGPSVSQAEAAEAARAKQAGAAAAARGHTSGSRR